MLLLLLLLALSWEKTFKNSDSGSGLLLLLLLLLLLPELLPSQELRWPPLFRCQEPLPLLLPLGLLLLLLISKTDFGGSGLIFDVAVVLILKEGGGFAGFVEAAAETVLPAAAELMPWCQLLDIWRLTLPVLIGGSCR